MNRTFKWAQAVALSSLLLTPATAVMAQEPDSVIKIEPVLVRVLGSTIGTAAPYPVSVLAGPELTRGTAPVFIEEALRAVPGVQVHNRYNFSVGERIAVRGFGPRSQFGVRGIRVLIDGIPATLPDGQATLDHLDLAGLGRVEALRGPNAALYGNGAGGVLHFRTLDPSTVPAEVSVRSTGGTHGLWTVQGNVTGTSGNAGYRVGYSRMDFDGYRRNPIADDGTAYGAATRHIANGTVTFPIANGTVRVVANGMNLEAENPGSLPQATLDEGNRAAWGFNVISGAFKDVRQGQLGGTWTGPIGSTTAQFAGWGIRRELFNPIPGRVIDLDRYAGGVRALFEGSVDAGQGTFSWGAGGETEWQRDDRQNFGNDGGEPEELRLDQVERVQGAGVFVQGRFDTGSSVSLLAGLRYDNVHFEVDDYFLLSGDPNDSGSRSMDQLSPSIGVVVAAAENVEIFASGARSFETPTTTELANQPTGAGGFNPSLEPQIGTTFEGGARATLNDRFAVEASVFRTKLEDGLVPFEVATDPGRTYFRNAASTVNSGFEVSVDGSIAPGLKTRIAYTNVDAEYDVYQTADDDFSGNKVPGLAPQRLDGLLIYDHAMGFVELRGLWQDDVPVDDDGSASSPSYFIADVRLGMSELRLGQVDVAPFIAVANIFDETYNSSVVPNAFGSRYFEPGPTRTFRFGLGVTWGR